MGREDETILHVLRDCGVVRSLWRDLKEGICELDFVNLLTRDWFCWNLTKLGEEWALIFGLACWLLWSWRNRSIFEEGYVMPDDRSRVVLWYVEEMKRAKKEFGAAIGRKQEASIRWRASTEGWFKLNIDGASKGHEKLSGCGGLLRGSDGRWIGGFTRKLGCCTAIKAELWPVLTGLELAMLYNLDNLIVECEWVFGWAFEPFRSPIGQEVDSTAAVSLLQKLQDEEEPSSSLLRRIGSAMKRFRYLKLMHTYREGNACADALANFSFTQ